MDKIAVMGDYDSIYGFAALGLSTFPVENAETARKRLSTLVNSGYGIIYVTELSRPLVQTYCSVNSNRKGDAFHGSNWKD